MPAPEIYAGVGGGVLATVVAWFLGRTDSAAHRREKEIRSVASAVCAEIEKDVKFELRIDRLEQSLPRLEHKIDQNNAMTAGMLETLTDIARANGIDRRTRD